MIKKLETLFESNSNTPSREAMANRDKINELVKAVNKLEQSSIIRNGPMIQDLLDGILKIKEHALQKARERLGHTDE